MEAIRVVTDISQHVDCSGLMVTSQEATQYILEHEGLETNIAGAEMVCLHRGERIRLQAQVETPDE